MAKIGETLAEKLVGKRFKDLSPEEKTLFYKLRERYKMQNPEYAKMRHQNKVAWRNNNRDKAHEAVRRYRQKLRLRRRLRNVS